MTTLAALSLISSTGFDLVILNFSDLRDFWWDVYDVIILCHAHYAK